VILDFFVNPIGGSGAVGICTFNWWCTLLLVMVLPAAARTGAQQFACAHCPPGFECCFLVVFHLFQFLRDGGGLMAQLHAGPLGGGGGYWLLCTGAIGAGVQLPLGTVRTKHV
jgi:hypothetical protein